MQAASKGRRAERIIWKGRHLRRELRCRSSDSRNTALRAERHHVTNVSAGRQLDTSVQALPGVAWRNAAGNGVPSVIRGSDTTPEAAAIQSRVIARLTVAQRLELAFEMSQMGRALARARLREEHADWDDADLDRELLRLAFAPDDLPRGL